MPFTPEQFLALFASYNAAIFPLQAVTLAAAGLAAALVALRPGRATDAAVAGILAAFSALTGGGYFLLGFTRLSPAGYGFAAIFLAEAALLALAALRPGELRFGGAPRWRAVAGAAIALYGLVAYPLLGLAARPALESPWMGVVPCPTTIFTLGLLLLARTARPARYLAPLIAWSAIGTVAALRLGIREDLGMTVAALVAAASLAVGRRAARGSATATASAS